MEAAATATVNTGNWITIIVAIIGVAVTWGALQAKIAQLKEIVVELKAGRERTGERIAKLEQEARLLRYIVNRGETLVGIHPRKDTPNPEDT